MSNDNTPEIKPYEVLSKEQLRFYVLQDNNSCGAIDFIADKMNFNIYCKRNFFKGMDKLKNIILNYEKEKVAFILSNKKALSFKCSTAVFEQMITHIEYYKDADTNQKLKDSFFND